MMTRSFILTLAATFCVGGGLQGQEAYTQTVEHELRTMVAEAAPARDDLEVVRSFLTRASVDSVATKHGLDLERASAVLATLDGEAVADLAKHVRAMDDEPALVGGNTIVVSTTAVIIALLILILINQ